jgi:hypothetical protein
MRTVLAALALAASGMHTVAASPQPKTLYLLPSHQQVAAFAQDGSYVAWLVPSSKGCNVVHVLALANGGQIRLPDESANAHNVTCRWEVVPPVRLALAAQADDVLWTLREPAPLPFDYVLGAGFTDPQERRFGEIAHGRNGTGLWLGGVAGSGRTLVYAVSSVAYIDQVACLAGGSCRRKLIGGGIYRIIGDRNPPPLVPGTRATIAVTASGNRIADVQAAAVERDGTPVASASLPVEVRDADTGKVIARVVPRGVPEAVALSPTVLATLERSSLGLRIAWYDPDDGSPLGSVPVPTNASPELSAGGRLIVFRVGRSIRAVNVDSHKVLTLTKAAATPIGLSVQGSRVTWAENVRGRGRIRALFVGGRG